MKLTVQQISELIWACRSLKGVLGGPPPSNEFAKKTHRISPSAIAEQLSKIDLTGQMVIARNLQTINQICDELEKATVKVG